jgi:uncharacterized protein YbjT (DUF2867 family)
MNPIRICLVGATGLVGTALIAECIGREDVRLVAVARREVLLPKGARMEVLVADPAAWPDAIAASNASVLVSALGTTWQKERGRLPRGRPRSGPHLRERGEGRGDGPCHRHLLGRRRPA